MLISIITSPIFPSHVVQEILGWWIEITDLATLDTAICNKNARLTFLQILASKEGTFNGMPLSSKSIIRYYTWLKVRSISVAALTIPRFTQQQDVPDKVIRCLSGVNLENVADLTSKKFNDIMNRCPHVRDVILGSHPYGCKLGDSAIHRLATTRPNLRSLTIIQGIFINDSAIQVVARECGRHLEELTLRYCINIGNLAIKAVASNCLKLRQLEIMGNSHISSDSITELLQKCPTLRSLSLKSCWATVCAEAVSSSKLQLRRLVISQNSDINCWDVEAITLSCPLLEHFELCGCSNIGDTAIRAVMRNCTNLRVLILESCPGVTDRGLCRSFSLCEEVNASCSTRTGSSIGSLPIGRDEVSKTSSDRSAKGPRHHGPSLRALSLNLCHVTDAVVAAIVKRCTQLVYLDLSHSLGACMTAPGAELAVTPTDAVTDVAAVFADTTAVVEDTGAATVVSGLPNGVMTIAATASASSSATAAGSISPALSSSLDDIAGYNEAGDPDLGPSLGTAAISPPVMHTASGSLSSSVPLGLLSDVSLVAIGSQCSGLEYLILNGSHGISREGVLRLVSGCRSALRALKLDFCDNVCVDATLREQLLSLCPALRLDCSLREMHNRAP